jgi:hypothetical protein
MRFLCPRLGRVVELTPERAVHIARRHPDLVLEDPQLIALALADPDRVRRSRRSPSAVLFSRQHGGRHIVVVVENEGSLPRSWIITAYLARRLAGGEVEWQRG